MALVRIKNTSGDEGTWLGITLADNEYYDIPTAEQSAWADDEDVFADVANQNLTVNDGVNDITNAMDGWKILEGVQTLPISDIDSYKVAVHTSYKPKAENQTYAVWTGAGDDMASSPHGLGEGPMLHFKMEQQTGSPLVQQTKTVKIEFDPAHGKVWAHEGYLRVNNGGFGDYIESSIIAYASPIAAFGSPLTLKVTDNWITYTNSGDGTHNFAGTPVLIPRSYSKDGDWDWDGQSLTPNFAGTGGYKISSIQRKIHHYFNKVPCCGSFPYFSMTSDETTLIPQGYFIEITACNVSNTNWDASIIIEIYRERTFVP